MKKNIVILIVGIVVAFFAASCHKDEIILNPVVQIDLELVNSNKMLCKATVAEFEARVLVEYEYDTVEYKCTFIKKSTDTYIYDITRSDILYASREVPFHISVDAVIGNERLTGVSETLIIGIEDEAILVSFALWSYYGGHMYVDLGLPSGTLWSVCNMGADKPEEFGGYYAWGETTTKSSYNWNTYGIGSELDSLPVLDDAHDAVAVNWGYGWRMPSREEFDEIVTYCTMTWATRSDVNGYLITGPNGNTMFLPASGGRGDGNIYESGSCGFYWLNSVYTDDTQFAWGFLFDSNSFSETSYYRMYGQSIRPVCNRD